MDQILSVCCPPQHEHIGINKLQIVIRSYFKKTSKRPKIHVLLFYPFKRYLKILFERFSPVECSKCRLTRLLVLSRGQLHFPRHHQTFSSAK